MELDDVTSRARNRILVLGTDDWLTLAEVQAHLEESQVPPRDIQDVTIQLALDLLNDGLVELGDVTEETGFAPWSEARDAAHDRMHRAWRSLGITRLRPGDVCWLRNTEQGHVTGAQLLREHAPGLD